MRKIGRILVGLGVAWPAVIGLSAFMSGEMADFTSHIIPGSSSVRQSIILWWFNGGQTTWGTLILICLAGGVMVACGLRLLGGRGKVDAQEESS